MPRYRHAAEEDDFAPYVDCIHFNPAKHGHASSVKKWPCSTLHRNVWESVCQVDWEGGGNIAELEFD
jgi:putative transposase